MINYKDPGPIEFDVNLPFAKGRFENSSTWVMFPYSVEEKFGVVGRVPVKVWFEDIFYRGSLVKMNSTKHQIIVLKEIQKQINEKELTKVHIRVELDTEPSRVIELPKDIELKLDNNPEAKQAWDKLSYSHKREYYQWITGAKKEETRMSRIDKMIVMLIKKS